jgi:NAD kinase
MQIDLFYIEGKCKDVNFKKQVDMAKEIIDKYSDMSFDMCVVIGGDGTLYRAANKFDKPLLFIRPVNNRSSAVMSDHSVDDLGKCLQIFKEYLAKGKGDNNEMPFDYQVLPRMDVSLNNKLIGNFMADMWIDKTANLNTIEMELEIEYNWVGDSYGTEYMEKHYYDIFKADGVLMYLPIGSAAYNKVLGGPIADWDMEMVGIRLMGASRTLAGANGYQCDYYMRNFMFKFAGWEGETALLHMDWTDGGIPVKYGDEITVKLSDRKTSLLRVCPESICEKLIRYEAAHRKRGKAMLKKNKIFEDMRKGW